MSVDEFLAWDAPGPWKWQLVHGEPVAMAPSSVMHGAIQSELARIMGNHLRPGGGPCIVVTGSGVVPRATRAADVRIPDLAVTCSLSDRQANALRAPVLIVEILSPSNERSTRANIWTYLTVPSVREVLLIRTDTIGAELLRRETDGNWPAEPASIGGNAMLELTSIGLRLPLSDVYATTWMPPA